MVEAWSLNSSVQNLRAWKVSECQYFRELREDAEWREQTTGVYLHTWCYLEKAACCSSVSRWGRVKRRQRTPISFEDFDLKHEESETRLQLERRVSPKRLWEQGVRVPRQEVSSHVLWLMSLFVEEVQDHGQSRTQTCVLGNRWISLQWQNEWPELNDWKDLGSEVSGCSLLVPVCGPGKRMQGQSSRVHGGQEAETARKQEQDMLQRHAPCDFLPPTTPHLRLFITSQ